MTHGDKNGWLRAYDIRYNEHEFINCFNVETNSTLLGKPVIIIIQACRGHEPANAVNQSTSQQQEQVELDFDEPYTLLIEADRLIFHSSYIGRASIRAREGSWFIQALCDKINKLADVDDFETICREVKKHVAIEKQHNMPMKNIVAKQIPVVTTSLTRLLYFKRCGRTVEVHHLRQYFQNYEINRIRQNAPCKRDDKKMELRVYQENTPDVCACNEYFDYLKKILRLFISENPHNDMAQLILNVAQNDLNTTRSGRAAIVDLIRKYLISNLAQMKHREFVYLGRPCCNFIDNQTNLPQ